MSRVVEARILRGFRDFVPEEQARRVALLDVLARSFERCGFAPIATPALEYADILAGKYGEEGEKLLYSFMDHGERRIALRYDLTVPLARFVAQHRDLPRPFKRYQIASVWRAEKPAHGRFREFMQCDADTVGATSPLSDADTVATGILALKALGLERFDVRIGHRAVLNGLLRASGIEDPQIQVVALRTLDKSDKVGLDTVQEMLSAVEGIGSDRARGLLDKMQVARELASVDGLLLADDVSAHEGIAHLSAVFGMLRDMGLGARVGLDLSIARGLDYYTGIVYETTLQDLPGVGSVMSGGRYDGLLEMFGMGSVPAVGISIGVDRLFSALEELGCLPEAKIAPTVVICPFVSTGLGPALGLLSDLRSKGIRAEMVPDAALKAKKQIEYAGRRGARYAIILGESEIAGASATIKDLTQGSQEGVAMSDVPSWLLDKERH